jgi:hypothetical protein
MIEVKRDEITFIGKYLKLKEEVYIHPIGNGESVTIQFDKKKKMAVISFGDTSLFPMQETIHELTKEEFLEVFNEASEIIKSKI